MSKFNLSIEQRVSQFEKYYKKENERPLLGFFIGSEYPLYRYRAFDYLPEDINLCPNDFDVDAFLEDCDRLFQQSESYGGDFIWSASAFWGIPWVEAALGCEIYSKRKTGSIHSEPPKKFSGADSIPVFNENNPWVIKMKEFLNKMAERSNGRWPIGTTRMRGISDLLAALYGGQELIYKMMEDPEEIESASEKLTDFFIKFANFQTNLIPPFHDGIGSFYYNMWAPRNTVWLQEDTTALLSPSLYEEYIERWLGQIANTLGNVIIHQHSVGFVPTKSYLKMNMQALEMHIDEGGKRAEELFDIHKSIMEKSPLLIWGDLKLEDFKWIMENLSHKGLALSVLVNSLEDAQKYFDEYEKYYTF